MDAKELKEKLLNLMDVPQEEHVFYTLEAWRDVMDEFDTILELRSSVPERCPSFTFYAEFSTDFRQKMGVRGLRVVRKGGRLEKTYDLFNIPPKVKHEPKFSSEPPKDKTVRFIRFRKRKK